MKKLFLTVVLLLTLALVFTACGGGDDTDGDTDGNGQQQQEANGDVAEAEPEGPPTHGRIHPLRDMGGRTLYVGCWFENALIGAFAWGDEPVLGETANYEIVRMQWDNARRVENLFNVRFEQVIVPHTEFAERLNIGVLAREPFADVLILDGGLQVAGIQGGLLRPWCEAADLPNSDVFGDQIYMHTSTLMDGKTWTIMYNGPNADGWGIGFNLDIIEAEGLPNPLNLYAEGNWNWDTMLYIMQRATTRDAAGVTTQFGLGGVLGGGHTSIAHQLIVANDGMLVDGDFNYAVNHPNTVEALEFIERILREGLWNNAGVDSSEDWGANWDAIFYAGLRQGNTVFFPTTTWALGNVPPAFEIRWMPFPKGPSNTSGATWGTGLRQTIGLAAGSDWEVEDILILMEELFSWADDEPEIIFEAGQYFWMQQIWQEYDCILRGLQIGASGTGDISLDTGAFQYVVGAVIAAVYNQEMELMQAIEHYRGPHQEMLDAMFRD